MNAESQLLSMMSNDLYAEAYKETLEDFGFELNLVQDLVRFRVDEFDLPPVKTNYDKFVELFGVKN